MTTDSIHTDLEFQDALRELVQAAEGNGVTVEGGWVVERTNGDGRWDIEIVGTVKRDPP